jgi:hypothetical protein
MEGLLMVRRKDPRKNRDCAAKRHWRAVLRAVADGLPLTKAVASDPRFPTYTAFLAYMSRRPAIKQHYAAARAKAGKMSGNHRSASARLFDVICRRIEQGEALVGICEDDGFPSTVTFQYFLNDHPEKRAAYNAACAKRSTLFQPQVFSEDDYNRALLHFTNVAGPMRANRVDGLPSYSMLFWRRKRDRAFAERYAALMEARASRAVEQQPSLADLPARVDRIVSKRLEIGIRAEIVSDIIFDVIEGKLGIDQIETAATSYVQRHKRQMAGYEFASLDRELFTDGSATLLDRISSDDQQFWSA